MDSNRGQRFSNAVLGEFTAQAGNQEDGLVEFTTAVGLQTLFRLANERFDHIRVLGSDGTENQLKAQQHTAQ